MNISLCIIDVSGFKRFNKNGALKYFDIIKNIIQSSITETGIEPALLG